MGSVDGRVRGMLLRRTNSLLARAGLEVRRKPQSLCRSPHELVFTPEFAAADLAIRTGRRPLTLLQVGAYDGDQNDPAGVVLRRDGWSGVLVEPQPQPFAITEARYADRPDVQTVCVAISDRDGTRDLFTVRQVEGMPEWAGQVASFDRSHVEHQKTSVPEGVDFLGNIEATPVRTWTFETLLQRSGVDHVDFLQIDAEGYDLELLRLFDVPKRLPSIINYEHAHLSRNDREAAASLLIAAGYKLAMSFSGVSGDTLAYRPPSES